MDARDWVLGIGLSALWLLLGFRIRRLPVLMFGRDNPVLKILISVFFMAAWIGLVVWLWYFIAHRQLGPL